MSRRRPKDHSVEAHSPAQGVWWFIIQLCGRAVGTIWLERGAHPDEAILGIFLGDESLFGQGIGGQAVHLALQAARTASAFRKVVLHVRENNARAIACYNNCGFIPTATDVKRTEYGEEIPFVTMQCSIG